MPIHIYTFLPNSPKFRMASKFLKLTYYAINPQHISMVRHIVHATKPAKYRIFFNTPSVSGIIFCGSGGFGTSVKEIEICSSGERDNYEKIKKWLDADS
jgi:hypothetical protein